MTTTARRKDAEENRIALLDAAARLLATDPDVPLEAIAAAAGLSRRAVYGHYANRDDLVGACIDRRAARLNALVEDVDLSDPRIALATLAARMWDGVESVRVMASFTVRGPQLVRVAEALAPVRALVTEIVEAGTTAGVLRTDVPVPMLARLVEQSAIAVLAEATAAGLSRAEGHLLVMLMTLGTAGLSADEAHTLISATPSLQQPIESEKLA